MTTTTQLVNGINKEVFDKSLVLSENILRKSDVITENYDVSDIAPQLYSKRRSYIAELVGEAGRYSFTPRSMYDATDEAEKLINAETDALSKAYDLTPLNSKEGEVIKANYRVLRYLRRMLKNEDYLNNVVPKHIIDGSAEYTSNNKPYLTSPKLSRWITKVVGESSELTKWYTNRCPKGTDVLGENTDYKLVLSVLPHDILGMSYYAPYNFGGERWLDGYNGTSCMDTIRNGDGSSMHQLPSNLLDETMMVAYLVKTDNPLRPSGLDDLEDVFHARMLVRVAEIEGQVLLLGQRIYASTRTEYKLIDEAMKLEFGKNYVHCNDLCNNYGGGNKTYRYDFENQVNVNASKDCPQCEGDGSDGWGDDCETCDGRGIIDTFETPYNDNGSNLTLGSKHVKFHIPKSFLEVFAK